MCNPVPQESDVSVLFTNTDNRNNVGSSEIHVNRMRNAVVWSLILQNLLLFTFILCFNFNVLDPLIWLSESFSLIFTLEFWFQLIVFAMIIYIQGEVCKKDYVTGPLYHSTRYEKIRHVFSIRNLFLLLLHMVIGITLMWTYSTLSFHPHFAEKCIPTLETTQNCLNERKFFLLLCGLWLGIYYFTNDFMFGQRNLSFPLIQQYKIYRVKAALTNNIKHSMKDSVLPSIIFFSLYYLYGGHLRSMFLEIMPYRMDKATIDSFQGMMDIHLVFTLWLFSCIFFVALRIMELLINVYLTEYCKFQVSNLLTSGNYLSLADSLKSSNLPIIQHLGYLDLCTLSTKDFHRRQELFSLSLPGGHGHSWNNVFKECTILIESFTTNLNKALQEPVVENIPVKTPPKPVSITFHSHNDIRRLASTTMVNDAMQKENPSVVKVAFDVVKKWIHTKREKLLKKPYIGYFFAESPDSRINYLFCQSQPVIWAVQSLAQLAAASLREDKYGIVQKDLCDLIVTIVNLKQVLDKLFKQNLIVKKSFANDPLETQMKYLLRTTVKRSLYLIAVSFGPYIKDLSIPCDVEMQINNFISFKEVF